MYLASAFYAYVQRAIEGYIQCIHFVCQQSEREMPSELRVGNAHGMFMNPNKHASCAINRVPGFQGNNSAPSDARDNSVSKSDNEHGANTSTHKRTCKKPLTQKRHHVQVG